MSLTGVLPVELIKLVIEYYHRTDNDAVTLKAVSKCFRELTPPPLKKNKNKNYYRPNIVTFLDSVPRIQWAVNNGLTQRRGISQLAGMWGQLEVLKWLRRMGYPFDKLLCPWAANGGHLEVIKWAMQEGWPWNETTAWQAAKYGHLEILKWIEENGHTWDWRECQHLAAMYGYLEILKWAKDKGYPIDQRVCEHYAITRGHHEMLEWLRS